MAYVITLVDEAVEVVVGADAYQQEGPLTTFFRTSPGRAVVDCWSTRLASFRTADIRKIRCDDAAPSFAPKVA
jgi:hypothetical protein